VFGILFFFFSFSFSFSFSFTFPKRLELGFFFLHFFNVLGTARVLENLTRTIC
jgi:hypothetical protein